MIICLNLDWIGKLKPYAWGVGIFAFVCAFVRLMRADQDAAACCSPAPAGVFLQTFIMAAFLGALALLIFWGMLILCGCTNGGCPRPNPNPVPDGECAPTWKLTLKAQLDAIVFRCKGAPAPPAPPVPQSPAPGATGTQPPTEIQP
jgi:hypothetical protein